MAIFTNQATLSYSGNVTTSNVTTGEIVDVLSITKTALTADYNAGGRNTYVISIVNSGTAAFTGLTVTDDLGGFEPTPGTATAYPLSYEDGSLLYYVNGTLQATPTVTAGPPMTVTGINVPAGGNATIVYEANVTGFAPLDAGSTITNTAALSGGGLTTPATDDATVTVSGDPMLTISKSLTPTTVNENGQITYTFVIENYGNVATTVGDNPIITDTFDPILDITSVVYDGSTAWTQGTNYTYDTGTGLFRTNDGQITVPAATFTTDPVTGAVTAVPGVVTLSVTGTV